MSKFGQYQVFDRIAVGGMAEVFRGRAAGEEGFEKSVAIKRILPAFARDGRFVSMLVTEARIHSSLTHRNIVQIHDLGVSQDGEYFIVLEYVDGHDLSSLLSRLNERRARSTTPDRVSDTIALHIAIELGEGIHFAHELRGPEGQPLGLVHRDISPSNVLLSYAGEVKLSDFGLAKRRTDHSVVGSLKGKLSYMSPEQARRAPIDRRSDLFSLGAVLYEMLAGQPLRTAGDNVASWQQVASGLIPPVRRVRPDLAPGLERLVTRALAPDPRDRFADARAFIDEARGVLDELPRSRVGETTDLQNLLKAVLPPGTLRPTRQPSRVIRLQSEIFGVETLHALGSDLTVPGDLEAVGLSEPSAVTSIASLESLRMSTSDPDATPPPPNESFNQLSIAGQDEGHDQGLEVAFTPPPVTTDDAEAMVTPPPADATMVTPPPVAPPPSLTPPLPIPAAAALEWPRPRGATAPATPPSPSVVGPTGGRLPGRPRGEPRRSAAGQIEVDEESADIHDDPTTSAREDGNRIIAAWPSLFDHAAASPAPVEEAGPALTPPLGSLGASPPVLPYSPPGIGTRTPPGGVQAPAPTSPPFPPSHSAPLSASALPPAAALPESAVPLPSPVGTMTLPYSAPRERIDTPPLSALVGEARGPSKFPHTLTGGTMAPPELRAPSMTSPGMGPSGFGSPGFGAPTPVASSFFAPPPPAQPIAPMSSLAPYAIEGSARETKRGAGARFARVLLMFTLVVAGAGAVVHYTVVPLPVLAVWREPARLSVRSEPGGATVTIDGRRLSAQTPTDIEVTRDRVPHEVTVTLAGYEPATQALRFDRAVDLEATFVLSRGAGAVAEADGGAQDAGADGAAGAAAAVAGLGGDAGATTAAATVTATTTTTPGSTAPGLPGGPGTVPRQPSGTPTAAGTTTTTKASVRKTGRRNKRGKGKTARQRRAAQRGAAATPGR
jgi:serine/threonine protein kinase